MAACIGPFRWPTWRATGPRSDPDDIDLDMVDPAEVQRFHALAKGSVLAEQLPSAAPPEAPPRRVSP